jgi:hypothetical protein
VDPHRNFPADEPDGAWYQQEREYPDAEWDRRAGDPLNVDQRHPAADATAGYGQAPGYGEPPAQYGDHRVPEPRGGYQPEADSRYGALTDPGELRSGDGGPATGRLAPVGQRPGDPLPTSPAASHFPPEGGPPAASFHAERTSDLPHVVADSSRASASPYVDRSGGNGSGEPVRHAAEPLDRAALRRPSGGPGQLGDGVYRSRRPGTAAALVVITALFELVALRLLAATFFAAPVQVGGSIASAFLAVGMPMFGLGMYALLGGVAAGSGTRIWLRTPLVYLPVALTLFLAAGLAA